MVCLSSRAAGVLEKKKKNAIEEDDPNMHNTKVREL